MPNNKDQVCIITVLFNSPDDAFAISVKAKIQEMLAELSESHVDIRIGAPARPPMQPRG